MTANRPTYLLSHASVLARTGLMDEAVELLGTALRLAPDVRSLLPGFPEFVPLLSHPGLRPEND